jgi:Lar family restriction alleviation protein
MTTSQSVESAAPELLPCPFCGGKAAWSEGDQKTIYGNEQVYCSSCYAMTPPEGSKAEAAEWWNSRTDLVSASPQEQAK